MQSRESQVNLPPQSQEDEQDKALGQEFITLR